MNIRLAIFLGKGGVGKSTSAYALSSFLSANSHVLAIDPDPQATMTNALLTEKPQYGVYDALTGTAALEEAIVPAAAPYGSRLSVLAATSNLATLEQETAGNLDRYYILRDLLDSTHGADFTVIDTPPSSTSLMTVAALVAAT
jgi:cellulose biosynthesis protein BcsQ